MNKNELKNLLDFVKENENRKIFGIFENTVYYLPEQEDLYILPKDTIIDNGFHLKEIRCMLEEYINDNYNFTKKILSDNYIINEEYQDLYEKYFKNNIENIFQNKKFQMEQLYIYAVQLINSYKQEISKEKLYEICKLRIFGLQYAANEKITDCLKIYKDYHIKYLSDILEGIITPSLEEIEEDFNKIRELSKDTNKYESIEFLEQTLINIEKYILLNQKEKTQSFKDKLTQNEQDGLQIILSNLNNGEGNIIISKLVDNCNLSRPVFKNVLQKMKDFNIAEVINMGMKGTYVKLLDLSLLK